LLDSPIIRDNLYFELNNKGFGVVSLYHTLIKELPEYHHNEIYLSNHILNLPLHQDTNEDEIGLLVTELKRILKTQES